MTNEDKALVKQLREEGEWLTGYSWPIAAAIRIEALSAENERLRFECDLNATPVGIIQDRARMEERNRIVTWLRAVGAKADAQAIENGEHLR